MFHVVEEVAPLLHDDVPVLGRAAVADGHLGATERRQTQHDKNDAQHLRKSPPAMDCTRVHHTHTP